jgi:hypothetical protein
MKVPPHNFKEIKHPPRPTAPFNRVSHTHPGGGHPLHPLKKIAKKMLKMKPRKRKM